jgi:hypothetical protein
VHPVVSPDNWNIYSELRDLIDKAEKDTLALLKAQAPRVMTLEEFNAHWKTPPQERQPIWEEWKFDNGKGKWKMYGRATGGYGELWRCWTARPDQATREATPWERSN